MRIVKKRGNKLVAAIAVIAVIIGFVTLGGNSVEHIEDTNGAENFKLQKITDNDIIAMEMGAKNIGVSNNGITNMTQISSKQFTGVYKVLYSNLLGKSDFLLNIYDFKIEGGNFKMAVVHDGKIVGEITTENCDEFLLEDINGTVSLVVAGESANFSFKMATIDYDSFAHS